MICETPKGKHQNKHNWLSDAYIFAVKFLAWRTHKLLAWRTHKLLCGTPCVDSSILFVSAYTVLFMHVFFNTRCAVHSLTSVARVKFFLFYFYSVIIKLDKYHVEVKK